ncbi:protein kinase-like domain-containing protein [Xylariomycetidae sp. FL2044]|nr:protein kinase-like domain-containing protein [Xylariomycetidae sp. FL2044]
MDNHESSSNTNQHDPATMTEPVTPSLSDPRRIDYADAVQGHEVYNFFGNRVIKHTTSSGQTLAIKVKPPHALDSSEGDMMHYAATNGVLAPRVRGTYYIVAKRPIARVLVSEYIPGVPLADVWEDLGEAQKSDIKAQLRTQLGYMRACTQSFVGRVGRQPVRNVYDRIPTTYCGPFADEEEFDNWCLARVPNRLARWRWRRMLKRSRRRDNTPAKAKYVLTHGDLTPRNILVQDGRVTGIVDWERSGFFPEYAEYAFAMCLCHSHEKWWLPVLEELLQPCSAKRLEFTRLVEDRGW